MNETKRTPGPWSIERGGRSICGTEAIHTNGRKRNKAGISSASYSDTVCEFDADFDLPGPRANAVFIVRACNAHDELVAQRDELLAACEWAKGMIESEFEGTRGMLCEGWPEFLAAIAKAKP